MSQTNPIVTITMEDGGRITAELLPEQAPNTVNNFISLINQHFYDGLIFHRVIPGFMIQGGCPEGNGTGGPGYAIRQEFLRDPEDPNSYFPHTRGALSMARAAHPDSAGSQFFVVVEEAPFLDGQYTTFGRVTEGMETVDAIVNQPRNHEDRPDAEQRMRSVEVDTFGVSYPEPQRG